MTINYETVTSETGAVTIVKTVTGSDIITLIPLDPANADYQRYLAWLENPETEHFTPNLTV